MLDALTVGVRGGKWHALTDKVCSELNLFVSARQVIGKQGATGDWKLASLGLRLGGTDWVCGSVARRLRCCTRNPGFRSTRGARLRCTRSYVLSPAPQLPELRT